ncbi:potassium-transporting ATPase subunit C [Luteolibacter flavescens]|uniref:Potassium-transporting ATPase subunit C n=1 Tax=Luteolibacter flavescens TaxID=1859460 RepID=A0ABT3FLD4_9BACT|nr:potassium-transporting ATPase subunit C [Luteolibacter flavescens]MCW1884393.1 potassium-transporting ATPase subunit C [Luteolibacter flavescens]
MKHPLLITFSGIALATVGWLWPWDDGERLPDGTRAAMILLQSQQSGPAYFHPENEVQPDEQGISWISPQQALGQLDRVMRERKLTAGDRQALTELISEASEPHPSRAIGGQRINVARLNVAMDARQEKQ